MADITSNVNSEAFVIVFAINNYYNSLLIIHNEYVQFLKYRRFRNINRKQCEQSSGDTIRNIKTYTSIALDWNFLHYYVKELNISQIYRNNSHAFLKANCESCNNKLIFNVVPPRKEIIDYQWNEHTSQMVWERAEVDHTMSWLSTLGGAFSALGEEFNHCAEMAGKISFHQLGLALRLGDPMTVARCKLYLSLSLIQRGSLKLAKRIILQQYDLAKNAIVEDTRLIKMCQGIWSKLQYSWKTRNDRKINIIRKH